MPYLILDDAAYYGFGASPTAAWESAYDLVGRQDEDQWQRVVRGMVCCECTQALLEQPAFDGTEWWVRADGILCTEEEAEKDARDD